MRKRLAVIAVVLVAILVGLAAGTASPAEAKGKPCWERVLDDWLDNNNIDGKYPVACLKQALNHAGEDMLDYSNFPDQIDAAMQAALRGGGPSGGNTQSGGGSTSGSGNESGNSAPPRKLQNVPDSSYYRRAIDNLGTTSADSLPIPLLVLAGLGTALLLTAGGLAARKRFKARPRPPAA